MRIGIDISQIAYVGTGVAEYLQNLVINLLKVDTRNEYILFGASLRKDFTSHAEYFRSINKNVTIKTVKIPPTLLDLMWNHFHIMPIERFVGDIDVFISSDWTQPPVKKAKSITILYDLIVYKHPEETAAKIIATQKRKLRWSRKECDKLLCISEATKNDAIEILKIPEEKLEVIYPGMTL